MLKKSFLAIALTVASTAAMAQMAPPPPPTSQVIREATATVKVKIVNVDATGLAVETDLCEVTGTTPVYETATPYPFTVYKNIPGCKATINGQQLDVFVGTKIEVKSTDPLAKSASVFVQATLPDEPPANEISSPLPAAVSEGTVSLMGANIETITLQALRSSRFRLSDRVSGVWLEATATLTDK